MPPTVVPAETALLVAQAGPILLDLLDFIEGVQCWVKNQEGVYCWVNRAFLLNYSKETGLDAVLGKTDFDLSPKHLAEQFRLDDAQVLKEPQIVHRGLMHTFPHDDELGFSVVVPKASYQMSETKAHIHSPPPRFGQHTDQVLGEMGFSKDDIARLHSEGIV